MVKNRIDSQLPGLCDLTTASALRLNRCAVQVPSASRALPRAMLAVRLHMNRPSHFFNIESADQLFGLLKTVAKRFLTSNEKQTEDFLLLVFGLTHLREWIAPDYDWKDNPQTPAENLF